MLRTYRHIWHVGNILELYFSPLLRAADHVALNWLYRGFWTLRYLFIAAPLCAPLVEQSRHSGFRSWSQGTECSYIWQRTMCTASLTSAQLVLSNTGQAERIVTTMNCVAVCPHESAGFCQPSTKLVLGVKRPVREVGHIPSSSVKVKNELNFTSTPHMRYGVEWWWLYLSLVLDFVHLLPEEGDSFFLWNICNKRRW
jgi:hypothetical protein